MWIARTIEDARQLRSELDGRVALVATLGCLHAGHVSLIERSRDLADHVLVSIFVNPTQFGPNEDYERYPRPIDDDLATCRGGEVTGVFRPEVAGMYRSNQTGSEVIVPAMVKILEGESRPTHFAGVCRVVLKLLNILQPHLSCFGQKDYQQLRIIEALVKDLDVPVDIIECPTVRERDGLALSSRNRYLDAEGRRRAPGLYKALIEARTMIESGGESDPGAVESAMAQVMRSHHVEVEYAVVRHPANLSKLDCIVPDGTGGVAALVAGRVEKVRLIDSMRIGQ